MGTTVLPKTQKSGGFDQLQCRVLYPVDVPGEDGLRGSLKREGNTCGKYSASARRVHDRPRDDGLLGTGAGEFVQCMAWDNFCYEPEGMLSDFLDNSHGS